MFKTATSFLLAAIFFMFSTGKASAIVDPNSFANNRFGIHIVDENDLEKAAALVNSNGGEWGYVTVVIREDDRNIGKWQKTFDRMRKLKLIPLVRLATTSSRGVWLAPSDEDLDSWVYFLNSLNWVTQNRYVIIFNEPNHAAEWGGRVDPVGYAQILRNFRNRLKEASPDFFILPAGFDAAASNSKDTMDMETYLSAMYAVDKNIFTDLDGWTSHSYPNPGFSGKPTDTGKGTIKSYLWETNFLQVLGGRGNLPVFITETGWVWDGSQKSLEIITGNYQKAFSEIWKEGNVVAVTPFILNYQAAPFDKFSWTRKDSAEFYPFYSTVQSLAKTSGKPAQIQSAEFIQDSLPDRLITDSEYTLTLKFKNTGQSIWDESFEVRASGDLAKTGKVSGSLSAEPWAIGQVNLSFKTTSNNLPQKIALGIFKDGKPVGDAISKEVELIHPPSLVLQAGLGFNSKPDGSNFSLDLLENDNLAVRFSDITFENGMAQIKELHNVVPEKTYTFVLRKSQYLPKMRAGILSSQRTTIDFGRLIPLDYDSNQKLTPRDILSSLAHPVEFFQLLTGQP